MTIVAAIFTPVVLAYQGWTYWVFRQRIGTHHLSGSSPTPPAGAHPEDVVPIAP
jgi:cytochrome d ubiquinol oxidase subunit II